MQHGLAFIAGQARAVFRPAPDGRRFHDASRQYAQWLVGGLTFHLAADVIESAVAPVWGEIGRLGTVAAIPPPSTSS